MVLVVGSWHGGGGGSFVMMVMGFVEWISVYAYCCELGLLRLKPTHQVLMFHDHLFERSSLFCLQLHTGYLTLSYLKLLENINCHSGFLNLLLRLGVRYEHTF